MDIDKYFKQLKLNYLETIPDKFKCIKCKQILNDPYCVPCGHNFCAVCIKDYLDDNQNKCCGEDVDCKKEILVLGSTVNKSFYIIKEMTELEIRCVFMGCDKMIKLCDIEDHCKSCKFRLLPCPYEKHGCKAKKMTKKELKKHLSEEAIQHASLIPENNTNELNTIIDQNNEIKALKQELVKTPTSVVALQTPTSVVTLQTPTSVVALQKLTSVNCGNRNHLMTDSYDWFIDNYESKLNAAEENGQDTYFESESFYLKGYKLKLMLYPSYSEFLNIKWPSFIGIKFYLIKGDYDDKIDWPCHINLQFGIIDSKNNDYTVKNSIEPVYTANNDNEKEVWERPTQNNEKEVWKQQTQNNKHISKQIYYICPIECLFKEPGLLHDNRILIRTKIINNKKQKNVDSVELIEL